MKHLAWIALAVVVACDAPTNFVSNPTVPEGSCGADQYQYLIGRDATDLERVYILGRVRIIRPGQPVTMDYWPDRLNFSIDRAGHIERISCG